MVDVNRAGDAVFVVPSKLTIARDQIHDQHSPYAGVHPRPLRVPHALGSIRLDVGSDAFERCRCSVSEVSPCLCNGVPDAKPCVPTTDLCLRQFSDQERASLAEAHPAREEQVSESDISVRLPAAKRSVAKARRSVTPQTDVAPLDVGASRQPLDVCRPGIGGGEFREDVKWGRYVPS